MPSWVSPWKEQPLDLQLNYWFKGAGPSQVSIVSECPYFVYYNPLGKPPVYFVEERLPNYKGEIIGLLNVMKVENSKTVSMQAQLIPLGGKFRIKHPVDGLSQRINIVNAQAHFDLDAMVTMERKKDTATRISVQIKRE
jgi:hypothetical protein